MGVSSDSGGCDEGGISGLPRKMLTTSLVARLNAMVSRRILGIDFGTKRMGLAVSDGLGMTAQGLPTLQRTRIAEMRAVTMVFARPLMSGVSPVTFPQSHREGRLDLMIHPTGKIARVDGRSPPLRSSGLNLFTVGPKN